MQQTISTENNFDLLRLFAAIQVALIHMGEHLKIDFFALNGLKIFPGVPIFFLLAVS